jgi:hypothetical protein
MSIERVVSTVSLVLFHAQRVEPKPPITLLPDLLKSLGSYRAKLGIVLDLRKISSAGYISSSFPPPGPGSASGSPVHT